MRREDDGDTHINLTLDPGQDGVVNDVNVREQGGDLVVEIVPADAPGCLAGQPPRPLSGTYDYGICTGANVAAPRVGAHVRVVGPWALDGQHGNWAEIHPAWAILAE